MDKPIIPCNKKFQLVRQFVVALLILIVSSGCTWFPSSPKVASVNEGTPTASTTPDLPTPSPLPPTKVSPSPSPQDNTTLVLTDTIEITATVEATISLPITIEPATSYTGPENRVTIVVPSGGRYLVIGDSMTFGSVFQGSNTYVHICENRWPFVQQLESETGIASTASLDRGSSMINPFLKINLGGIMVNVCSGPAGLSTSAPGSSSEEWLNTLIYNQTFVDATMLPENQVVLFLLAADVFAPKLNKPPVTPAEYAQNLGHLFNYLRQYGKIIYAAPYVHVQAGTFIKENELAEVNGTIDQFNLTLREMVEKNGFLDETTGEWVDFGVQVIEQDGYRILVKVMQNGPDLDVLSDTALPPYRVFDGLHFSADGYNLIGSAWATSLKAPVRTTQIEALP